MNLLQYVCVKGGMNYVFMQCCSPFNLIAEKSEIVKAVKDQENRENIIFLFFERGIY